MTIKVRDAGALRTVDLVKVRGPDGALRTIDFIRVRGPDSVLREVFSAAGTPPAANPAYISPGSSDTIGGGATATAYFTAQASQGSVTAYQWGVLDGPGSIVSGATSGTAQLRITVGAVGEDAAATFYCDVTIGNVDYRATCTMTRYRTGSGGGGTSPSLPQQ